MIAPHGLGYQLESLDLLGLKERCRPTAECDVLIDDYYFSAPTSMIVCYNPYAVHFLRKQFLPRVGPGTETPKRFFVRRTTFARNIANESEVLDFFEQAGWAVMDTDALRFSEQIRYFSGAEAICAIYGSGTANVVWCSPRCKIKELFADTHLVGDQEWIAQCIDLEYSFLVFPSNHKLDALVDVQTLKEHLRARHLI